MNSDKLHYCSFCGKEKSIVSKLIVSDEVAICNECVTFCQELLQEDFVATEDAVDNDKMDPQQLKAYLDQYVIGQDPAKIMLAVAIINHYKRINAPDKEIAKANILMIGPTGSGKTLLAKTVAKFLDVPFAIADATSVTEAGYVGDDVESLISRLYANSGNDVAKTQRGIIFVDEIDKISRKGESASLTRDVSGEGVQQALLKLVEGTVCRIPRGGGRKHPAGDMIEIDTSNILFIAGGAFVGLENIVKSRVHGTSIGFNSPVSVSKDISLDLVTPDDLVRFGLIPEFVGRFPCMVSLRELVEQDLVNILTQVKNNYIDQYKWLFAQDNVDLVFDTTSISSMVKRALLSGTGARALHSEIERALMPHMYSLRQYRKKGIKQVNISEQDINNPRELL